MSQIKAEVLLTTSNDERYPGYNMVDGDEKTFWSTTGMYPQEVLIGFKDATVTLSKLKTASHAIRRLVVKASCETQPIKFKVMLDVEMGEKPTAGNLQSESFQINSTVGSSVKFVKLIIQSGWEDFSTIHDLSFEGEVESEAPAPVPSNLTGPPAALPSRDS